MKRMALIAIAAVMLTGCLRFYQPEFPIAVLDSPNAKVVIHIYVVAEVPKDITTDAKLPIAVSSAGASAQTDETNEVKDGEASVK